MSEVASRNETRVTLESRELEFGIVYELTVSNAARLNVVGVEAVRAMKERLRSVAANDCARLVILRGEGERAWIGGADIRELNALSLDTAEAFILELHELCQVLRRLPVPVVAAIQGYCLGAGLEIAASCDLRIATVSSSFGMPEVQVGIPSVIEASLLPGLIGSGRARDLVLTGRTVDAAEAYRWGLIEAPVEKDQFEERVSERVSQIGSAGARAIRLQKALCQVWEESSLKAATRTGVALFRQAYASDEPQLRMQAFLDRRRRR